MRKLFLFLAIFTYIYPVYFKFFPIPTDRILQLLGLGVCVLNMSFLKHILSIKDIFKFFFSSLVILVLIFFVQGWNYHSLDLRFFINHFSIFLNFFSVFVIIYLLYKIDKNNMVVNLLDSLVIISIIQAFISFVFFFNNNIYESYVSMLSPGTSQNFLDRIHLIEIRLIGISSSFVSGGVKYSIAFLIMIVLPYINNSRIYKNRLIYILSFITIVIAGIMTARTFFVVIPLGLFLFCIIEKGNFKKLIINIIPKTLIIVIILFTISTLYIDMFDLEKTYNFVFEMYINYQETGELTTGSTDVMKSMYVFPETVKTWIIGDGRMVNKDNSYYMHTDVGYTRLIFYFGVIFTIIYLLYQCFLYFLVSKKSKDIYFKPLIFTLFLWYLILNLKGLIDLENYLMLFFLTYGVDNLQKKSKTSVKLIET